MCVKMYFVLLIGLFIYVNGSSLNESTSIPEDMAQEECIQESGASLSQVKWLKAGHFSKSNMALKKWVLCYLVKIGVMSSAGVLRQHVVLRGIPEKDKNTIEKTIDKCLYTTPHDPVDTAWHYLACFRTKLPKFAREANRI